MGQLEKYGLYVMCLVIFLILGVTLWGEPANASKTRAKKEAAMHATLEDNTSKLRNAAFDPDQQQRRRGDDPISTLLKPENNPPKYEPVDDGNVGRQGGGVIGELIGDSPRKNRKESPENIAPTPAPKEQPIAAPAAKRRKYTVRSGDSFARIAKRELGSERYTKLLTKLNRGVNPAKMQIGMTLVLPSDSELGKGRAKTVNKLVATGAYRTYTVSKGDTFEKIARVELGSTKRVLELRQLNSNVNPRKIQIGQVIKLPLK